MEDFWMRSPKVRMLFPCSRDLTHTLMIALSLAMRGEVPSVRSNTIIEGTLCPMPKPLRLLRQVATGSGQLQTRSGSEVEECLLFPQRIVHQIMRQG